MKTLAFLLERVKKVHFFLPAAKPSGPRTVRVVGVGWGTRLGSHPKAKLGREERNSEYV